MVPIIGFIVLLTVSISFAILKFAKVNHKESFVLSLIPHFVFLGGAVLLYAVNLILPGINYGWGNLAMVVIAITFLFASLIGIALTIVLYLAIKR